MLYLHQVEELTCAGAEFETRDEAGGLQAGHDGWTARVVFDV